jgi:superfamily II DNA or RNA helicase
MLLHQTKLALEEALLRPIGIIGDSEWQLEDVTVACVSSLASKRGSEKIIKGKNGAKDKKVITPPDPRYKALRTMFDLVVFDEVHHLKGDKWHDVYMDFDAPYRIGLSATVYFDNESESERGVIWLKACCGGIKVDVPTSMLIEQGYLLRQNIVLHTVDQPDLRDRKWSKTLQNLAIYENAHRNDKICRLAKQQCDEGTKVLIISNRLNQVEYITQRLVDMGINAKCITGDDKTIDRKDMVLDYVTGDVTVLVGTVFGEGVDIPEVECVINAEGGRDVKTAIQRMRNLTPHDGKTKALFHDFIDTTNPYFAKHSLERIRTYRTEPAFNIRVADDV